MMQKCKDDSCGTSSVCKTFATPSSSQISGWSKVTVCARVMIVLGYSLFMDDSFGPLVVRDPTIRSVDPVFQTPGNFIAANCLLP